MTGEMTAQVIYLVMAALLFGSAAIYAQRNRRPGAHGPGWIVSLLVWAGIISLIVMIYQGAQFWSAIGSMLSGQ